MFTPRTRAGRKLWPAVLLMVGGLLCLVSAGAAGAVPARAQAAPTMLSGFVFNYKGEFVPGATITLYTLPAHVVAGPVATTDAHGAWSVDTGPGTFAVRATAPGYDFSEQTVYASSYQSGITSILRPTAMQDAQPLVAMVSGRVTSLDNVPLGGVNIVANNTQDSGVRQVAPPPVLNATVTNADGTYSLRVPAGRIWLTLKTGASWGYQLSPMNINPGQDVAHADFVVAVRVLPRSAFPTPTVAPPPTEPPATPTPISNVGPIIGMPATGHGAGSDLGWGLGALGLLLLAAGGLLLRRQPAA